MSGWKVHEAQLAAFASRSDDSRGRYYEEPEDDIRSPYSHDRDRVIHSNAFRRLQYKTQVFVVHEGDFFRTRLTHTLEVAQISRAIARSLNVNEDLAEAIALAHDIGHTPFGHAGEQELNSLLKEYGGFDHNIQSYRVAESLESRYADKRGLNLTWETREGLARHKSRFDHPPVIEDFSDRPFISLEAQICNVADEIAYGSHDLDDGVAAGLFAWDEIIESTDAAMGGASLLHECHSRARDLCARMGGDRCGYERIVRTETVRGLINRAVQDCLSNSIGLLAQASPTCADDVRNADEEFVQVSEHVSKELRAITDYLYQNMYHEYRVWRMVSKGRTVIRQLFHALTEDPLLMHPVTRARYEEAKVSGKCHRRVVADYIAGMTDRHAMDLHSQLFGTHDRALGAI